LNLIAEGYTNKEIADSLYLSVHTVETHRHHIMEKLNVHSTAALISLAVEKGILTKNNNSNVDFGMRNAEYLSFLFLAVLIEETVMAKI